MAKKLFVGNLSYSISEDELRNAFAEFGTVQSVKIVNDRESGRSKGFGFVEMESDEGAKQAVESLNGADIGGRPIRVAEAQAREERPSGGGYGGGGGGGGRRFGGGGGRGGRGGGGGGRY